MPAAKANEAGEVNSAVFRLPRDAPPIESSDGIDVDPLDWNIDLLREKARWFCRLRWFVVALLLGVGGAVGVTDIHLATKLRLTPGWLLPLGACLCVANILYGRALRMPSRSHDASFLRLLLWTQISVDLVALTVAVHFLGSLDTVAPFMYLFHIILACIFFPPGHGLIVTLLAASGYLICIALERVLTATDASGVPGFTEREWASVSGTLIIWFVIWYLASRLAQALRERDLELAMANARLVASFGERARHMLQTTHQLKAPFAAIHANTQLLLGGLCGSLEPKARDVIGKISKRSLALSRQIQDMIQLANLRSMAQADPEASDLDVGEVIKGVVSRLQPTAMPRGIEIEQRLKPARLRAIRDHLRMLMDNLISNAINYSAEGGTVEVVCRPRQTGSAVVDIVDRGIGIPADKLPRIFDDYFRTGEATRHNPSSTGLGLAIVRDVALRAGIEVEVESSVGKGTRFTLTIPPCPAPSDCRKNA